MRFVLGGLVMVLNFLDNATTFVCLRTPIPGMNVVEANPFARWLFDSVGLLQGLAFETFVSTAAVCFLVLTPLVSDRVRFTILTILAILPGVAVVNNLHVIHQIGLLWAAP